ncbi:helix-turn-helix domain-containing protein [Lacticaseibacillus hulanensis]|uniref:helix-turn-helix domain-containing protein n=1 Tax=Lacticaseibacillus hulanensis TaxID=2493111 RepID=UPI0013E3E556|nr:helix-turn-helix transcriptional regulator [Lacticaseibacillus hulanensis]
MHEFLIDLGVRIRQAREHAHMTQDELAEAMGVTSQRVIMWEHGRTRLHIDQVARIAQATDRAMWLLVPDWDGSED